MDFDEELLQFEQEYLKEAEKLAQQCAEELKEIIQENINKYIYGEYSPKVYARTYTLLQAVDIKVDGTNIVVYINPDLNTHFDNLGQSVSEELPYWLNFGYKHKNWSGGVDYYHQRLGLHFFEISIEEIKKKLEYKVFNFILVSD